MLSEVVWFRWCYCSALIVTLTLVPPVLKLSPRTGKLAEARRHGSCPPCMWSASCLTPWLILLFRPTSQLAAITRSIPNTAFFRPSIRPKYKVTSATKHQETPFNIQHTTHGIPQRVCQLKDRGYVHVILQRKKRLISRSGRRSQLPNSTRSSRPDRPWKWTRSLYIDRQIARYLQKMSAPITSQMHM
jgi:hypothetical protein